MIEEAAEYSTELLSADRDAVEDSVYMLAELEEDITEALLDARDRLPTYAPFWLDTFLRLVSLPSGPWDEAAGPQHWEKSARTFAARWGETLHRARAEFQIAVGQLARWEVDRGRATIRAALESDFDVRFRPKFLALLADLDRRMENWTDAQENVNKAHEALAMFSEPNAAWALPEDHPFVLDCRCQVAGAEAALMMAQGLLDQARPPLERERQLAEELWKKTQGTPFENSQPRIASLLRTADLYVLADRHRETVDQLDTVLATERLDPSLEAVALANLGVQLTYLEMYGSEDAPRAKEILVRALDHARTTTALRVTSGLFLAELQLSLDQLQEAEETLVTIGETLGSWNDRNDGSALVLESGHHAALAVRAARLSGDETAFSSRYAELETQYERFLEQWRMSPIRAAGLNLLYSKRRRTILSELILGAIQIDPKGGPTVGLEQLLRAQSQGTFARHRGIPTPTVSDLLTDLVGPRRGVLVLLPSLHECHVFTVDEDGVDHIPLVAGHRLRLPLNQVLAELRRPPRGRLEESRQRLESAAAQLRALLLPPEVLDRIVSWDHVQIVGADLFDGFSFACLPLRDGTPLGLAKAISHLPSIPIGVWLTEQQPASASSSRLPLTLVTATDANDVDQDWWAQLDDISLNERERTQLLSGFDPARIEVFEGPRARFDLFSAAPHRCKIFHFFGHGVFDGTRERPAGLLAAPRTDAQSGVIWCDQIDQIRSSELVILSACGTARGFRRLGEDGVSHLGGSFLGAGARTVLLADGVVAKHATLNLVEQFQRSLAAGRTPAQSLLEARRVVRSDPSTDHPFYSDQFRLLGLGHVQLFTADTEPTSPATSGDRSRNLAVVITAVFVIIFAAVLLQRRRGRPTSS